MKEDYTKTPSFYNNEEVFKKFLGSASYYKTLQDNIVKLIKLTQSKNVLELGCAIGTSSIKVATECPNTSVLGIDMRDDIIEIANKNKEKYGVKNTTFKVGLIQSASSHYCNADFIFLLYAFHHILDPLDNKINFLKDVFNNIKSGSYLCIGETFLPNDIDIFKDKNDILSLFSKRKLEGSASAFWNSLDGLTFNEIEFSKKVGNYCGNKEYFAGELVADRDDEYLVQSKWVTDNAKNIGFDIILDMPVDGIGDRIILIKKP